MKKTVLASRVTPTSRGTRGKGLVCDECPRLRHGGRLRQLSRKLRTRGRACLLEDGILCCGPAAPAGCHALCPTAGAPCIGCLMDSDAVAFQSAVLAVVDARLGSHRIGLAYRCSDAGLPDAVGRLSEYHQARLLLRRLVEGPPAAS